MKSPRLLLAGLLVILLAGTWVLGIRRVAPSDVPPVTGRSPGSADARPPASAPSALDVWRHRIATTSVREFRRLMEEALALGDPALREAVVRELVAAWVQRDLGGFTAYFDGLEVEGNGNGLAQLVAALKSVLPGLDPTVKSSLPMQALVQRLIPHLARLDPDEARRWAMEWLPEAAREASLVTVAREMARRDPLQALEVAREMTSPLRRMQAQAMVGRVWAGSDPDGALAWARSLEQPTERAMTLNSVLMAVAQQDPALAAAQLRDAERTLSEQYRIQRQSDLQRLGITAADEANDAETYRDLLESGAISGPESPDVELLADAGRVIAEKLARKDPAAATDFVNDIENIFLARKTGAGVLAGWAEGDPVAAVDYFKQNLADATELIPPLYESWAGVNAESAARGVELLPGAGDRAVARETVLGSWAAQDPIAASRYLDTVPPAERTDAAVATVAQALSHTAPEEAWVRAQSIRDPGLRFRSLKSAFSVLVTEQPETAQRLLASTPLEPSQAERLGELMRAVSP